jgi:hypothetical protein
MITTMKGLQLTGDEKFKNHYRIFGYFIFNYQALSVACDALRMSKASLEFVETEGGVLV